MRGNALGSLLGRNILLSGCNTHGNRRNVLARRTRAGSWRASACLFRGDQRLQRGYVDRFRDEGIEPDALRALPIGLAAVSRDGNENGSGAVGARASPYLGRESEAIHVREPDANRQQRAGGTEMPRALTIPSTRRGLVARPRPAGDVR